MFLCKETNKVYAPGENELFEYTGGYELLLSPEQQAVGTPAQEIETAVSAPKYEATVTAEEAPLLVRLMGKAGITPGRTDHENGDVTFSVAESEKDAVDRLISKLRTEAAKAVAAMSKPKKARRTRPEINYLFFA